MWSKCVDQAKKKDEDFKEQCAVVSKALFECTSSNNDYFKQLSDAMDEGASEDDESSETGAGAVPADDTASAKEGDSITTEH
jgi:GCK domain